MVSVELILGIVLLVALIVTILILTKRLGKKFFYFVLGGIGIWLLSGEFGSGLVFTCLASLFEFRWKR